MIETLRTLELMQQDNSRLLSPPPDARYIYDLLQSTMDDATPGLTKDDLQQCVRSTNNHLESCLLQLQLDGQVYQTQEGRYVLL